MIVKRDYKGAMPMEASLMKASLMEEASGKEISMNVDGNIMDDRNSNGNDTGEGGIYGRKIYGAASMEVRSMGTASMEELAAGEHVLRRMAVLCLAFVWILAMCALIRTQDVFGKEQSDPDNGANWRCGTWADGCYTNNRGEVMASFEQADRERIPKIAGMRKKSILYIGASRTCSAEKAVKDKEVFFYGCGGAGFKWFFRRIYRSGMLHQPAYQVIRAFLRLRPAGYVIIDLGGNDLNNLEAYVGFYRELQEKYPDAHLYFLGVMPREVGDRLYGERFDFNQRLVEEFQDHAIDLFDKVYLSPGFITEDGTHYSKKLSRMIHQMVMHAIGREVIVNKKTGVVRTISFPDQ